MLNFMLIGLPRSGTTWAANWLTGPDVFCMHDPLYKVHYSKWDTDTVHFPHKMYYHRRGVACTGIWRWPEFVNAHPARKLVVRRDFGEIQDSLTNAGYPRLEESAEYALHELDAVQVPYEHLFDYDKAKEIWHHLTGSLMGFCPMRHKFLCEMEIDPFKNKVIKNRHLQDQLYNEIAFPS